jgi:hypothetical protein
MLLVFEVGMLLLRPYRFTGRVSVLSAATPVALDVFPAFADCAGFKGTVFPDVVLRGTFVSSAGFVRPQLSHHSAIAPAVAIARKTAKRAASESGEGRPPCRPVRESGEGRPPCRPVLASRELFW